MERSVKKILLAFSQPASSLVNPSMVFLGTGPTHYAALIFLIWPLNVNKKKAVVMIFLDKTKAFDRVPHERMVIKITSYDLADPLYSCLTS